MKNNGKLTTATMSAIALVGMASTASAAAVLLGGFDGNNPYNSPKQDASAVGNVSVVLTGPGNNGIPLQTLSPLWGTTSFTPSAENAIDDTVAIFDTTVGGFSLTVSNTGSDDVTLDRLHWITKRDVAASPTDVNIAFTSGDLAGTNQTYSLGAVATTGFDINLSDFMSDLTLAPTESATFTWNFIGGSDTENSRLRVDNFALSGEVIPEPSAALLAGIGALVLLRRRRA